MWNKKSCSGFSYMYKADITHSVISFDKKHDDEREQHSPSQIQQVRNDWHTLWAASQDPALLICHDCQRRLGWKVLLFETWLEPSIAQCTEQWVHPCLNVYVQRWRAQHHHLGIGTQLNLNLKKNNKKENKKGWWPVPGNKHALCNKAFVKPKKSNSQWSNLEPSEVTLQHRSPKKKKHPMK